MKKHFLKFANSLLSREQMKSTKGGAFYCICGGIPSPIRPPSSGDCSSVCSNIAYTISIPGFTGGIDLCGESGIRC